MNEVRVQRKKKEKKVFSWVLFLPFWSFWAESLQNKPESCSCTPRRSCSVNPPSCSCRTLTRGNKCRRPGMRVQSPARWSSPSSASWTSCWAQTEKSFLQMKFVYQWSVLPAHWDADRVVRLNVEGAAESPPRLPPEQPAGAETLLWRTRASANRHVDVQPRCCLQGRLGRLGVTFSHKLSMRSVF